VARQVEQEVRKATPSMLAGPVPAIGGIVEELQCALCLSVTSCPSFVKHCLHFFCKSCIEDSLRIG